MDHERRIFEVRESRLLEFDRLAADTEAVEKALGYPDNMTFQDALLAFADKRFPDVAAILHLLKPEHPGYQSAMKVRNNLRGVMNLPNIPAISLSTDAARQPQQR